MMDHFRLALVGAGVSVILRSRGVSSVIVGSYECGTTTRFFLTGIFQTCLMATGLSSSEDVSYSDYSFLTSSSEDVSYSDSSYLISVICTSTTADLALSFFFSSTGTGGEDTGGEETGVGSGCGVSGLSI